MLQNPGRIGGRWSLGALTVTVTAIGLSAVGVAFQGGPPAGAGQEVIIKRESLKLIDPQHYKIPIYLEPVRQVHLSTPVASTVTQVNVRLGQREGKGAEAFRLDNSESALEVRRARARLQASRIEKRIADGKKDVDLQALADAHIEAAQSDVELAELHSQRLVVRMPFTAQVIRIHTPEGQAVRPGDPLATIAEVSKLLAEIPAEKANAAIGAAMDINIEQHVVKAKVEAVLPLNPRFDVLRDLGDELVSVVVAIDNLDARYQARQSVYTSLQPTDPVAVVATTTISNETDGQRKVQVLRDNTVRNVPVRILARLGTEKTYVSGKFREGDELIVQSSKELTDGTSVKALAGGGTAAGATDGSGAGSKGPIRIGPGQPGQPPTKAGGGF